MKGIRTKYSSKENPLTYRYVKMLKLFMWPLGSWPGEVLGEKKPFAKYFRLFMVAQATVIVIGHIIYLYKYFGELTFFMKGYACFSLSMAVFLSLVRLILPTLKGYAEIMNTFLMSFHLGHSKHKGKTYEQVFHDIEEKSFYLTVAVMVYTYTTYVVFTVVPVFLNYTNGFYERYKTGNLTFDCIVCITIPGVIDTKFYSLPSTIYTVYLNYVCAMASGSIDLLLSLMSLQIIGHFKVLNKRLESLPEKGTNVTTKKAESIVYHERNIEVIKMYNNKENEIVHDVLVEFVKHHRTVIAFVKEVSGFFGPLLGLTYTFHLFACCLSLLECSTGEFDIVLRFVPLTCYIYGQLIFLSVVFEIIATESEKLHVSVYKTPWELMDNRNRRSVYFMLKKVQTPVNITAMGMTKIGVTAMAQILKTTLGYFSLLRTLQQK